MSSQRPTHAGASSVVEVVQPWQCEVYRTSTTGVDRGWHAVVSLVFAGANWKHFR